MELPSITGSTIVVVCVAIFVLGAAYLIRKRGGLKNAIWGGQVKPVGDIRFVEAEPERNRRFSISTVHNEGREGTVLVDILDSDGSSWSRMAYQLTPNEALAVAKLFTEAAKRVTEPNASRT